MNLFVFQPKVKPINKRLEALLFSPLLIGIGETGPGLGSLLAHASKGARTREY